MTWYLILCVAGGSGGIACPTPQRMPDRATCVFIGNKTSEAASGVYRNTDFRCVAIPKALPR